MIYLGEKGAVPESLAFPERERPSKTTHQRRLELIERGAWIKHINYENRYKQADCKEALKAHYHRKCCYCEQKIEAAQVEHYRPKSTYWWLAYSWDNLLWICGTCNAKKSDNFKIWGQKAVYNPADLPTIHLLGDAYDHVEHPCLLNPERDEELEKLWKFGEKGEMYSQDKRGEYTIETLDLNRTDLRDERKKSLDEFREAAEEIYLEYFDEPNRLEAELWKLVYKFEVKARDLSHPFLAFRRYASETLIQQILIEIYS